MREQAGPRAQLLVRVKKSLKAKITQVLHDGSALIEVRVNHVGSNRLEAKLRLREVRGQVWRQSAGVAAERGGDQVRGGAPVDDPA